MNLLGAILYDPSTAVTKATSSLLAMTAFDTTNLRIAFTIPAHGKVRVRMACVQHGGAGGATVLLGVMDGSTVRGRVAAIPLQPTSTNTHGVYQADFVISGLTPGAVNWDAAYGVETVLASSAMKYGGPDNTTGNDAFGGFVFELWDPQPHPVGIAPGAIGGYLTAPTTANVGLSDQVRLLGTTVPTPTVAGVPNVNVKTWNDLATVALPLVPTVAGRALDVSAGGEAGLDWANIGGPTAAVVLSGTTVGTITTYTGNTLQTGDSFARIGAPAGVSVSADVAAVKTDTAAVLDDTGTSGVVVAAASKSGYALSSAGVTAIWAEVIEGTTAAVQMMRGFAAAIMGKASGLDGTTAKFRDLGDTKDRITATVDTNGNRTAVTTDLT